MQQKIRLNLQNAFKEVSTRARDAAPRGGSPFSVGLLFNPFTRLGLRAAGDFCFLLIIIIGCVLDDATYKIKKGTIYVICRLLGSDVKTNGVGRNGIAPSCFTDTHVFLKVIKRGVFLTGLRAVRGLRCLRS